MKNPIIWSDFPDLDVIRVDDTYYMVSTTMHVMPGCVLLRSYDLLNWEHCAYVYDRLDSTEAQKLNTENGIYGKGMWAATLRYHKGMFYVLFVANDTHKTYLYKSSTPQGPWEKSTIEGFYHDASLLFDDDGRTYIIYGNREIRLTELNAELTAPLEGGLDRVVLRDTDDYGLGFEGCHLYKINGKYYVFMIHWPKGGTQRRQEACYYADSLEGGFVGGNVVDDDMGYHNCGVAQGGIVDTPDGEWYGILFQDHGAVGRIPVVVPMHWENDFPVFGVEGKVPLNLEIKSTRPGYEYAPFVSSDDFNYVPDENGKVTLKTVWQWNHEPDDDNLSFTERKGAYRIKTRDVRPNMIKAVNSLTQRTVGPTCSATVTIDASGIKDGDYAGIGALQSNYSMIAVTKENGKYYIVTLKRNEDQPENVARYRAIDNTKGMETGRVEIPGPTATLLISFDFEDGIDEVKTFYQDGENYKEIGETVKLRFTLDHFMGCRISLSMFSTKEAGGYADFMNFIYDC